MPDQYVDAVICGVEIKKMKLMESRYPGFCTATKQRFPAGTQIAFLSSGHLAQDQAKAIFPNGKIYNVTVIWPLENATDESEDSRSGTSKAHVPDQKSLDSILGDSKPKAPEQTFVPSTFQEDILNTILTTDNHVLINALAGAGKTSTLVWIIKELSKRGLTAGQRVIYLAFNKSIQEELAERLQGTGVPALTTHAFGFQALRKKFGNNLKIGKVARQCFDRIVCQDNGLPFNKESFKAVRRTEEYGIRAAVLELVGYIKSWAIFPKYDGGWGFSREQEEAIHEFITMYEIEYPKEDFTAEDIVKYACRVIIHGLPDPNHGLSEIDYDDMLYLPLALNLPLGRFDLVLTDESQDFNACQILLLERLIAA